MIEAVVREICKEVPDVERLCVELRERLIMTRRIITSGLSTVPSPGQSAWLPGCSVSRRLRRRSILYYGTPDEKCSCALPCRGLTRTLMSFICMYCLYLPNKITWSVRFLFCWLHKTEASSIQLLV